MNVTSQKCMNGHCWSKLLLSAAHPQQMVHALHGQINKTLLGRLFLFWGRPVREQGAKEIHKEKKTHDVTRHSSEIFNLHDHEKLWDVS